MITFLNKKSSRNSYDLAFFTLCFLSMEQQDCIHIYHCQFQQFSKRRLLSSYFIFSFHIHIIHSYFISTAWSLNASSWQKKFFYIWTFFNALQSWIRQQWLILIFSIIYFHSILGVTCQLDASGQLMVSETGNSPSRQESLHASRGFKLRISQSIIQSFNGGNDPHKTKIIIDIVSRMFIFHFFSRIGNA